MRHSKRQRKFAGFLRAGLALAGILTAGSVHAWNGKWWCIDNCSDIPKGAIPPPAGTYVHSWQAAEVARADADDFVIYSHEWYMGGQVLGPYGQAHVDKIARRLPSVPFAVVLQPELNPTLNQVRRMSIVQQLLQAGIRDAEARVRIAFPQAEGLYGDEAIRIYARMLAGQGSSGGGYGGGIGGGGSGGFGMGSGFGGVGGSLGITSRGY